MQYREAVTDEEGRRRGVLLDEEVFRRGDRRFDKGKYRWYVLCSASPRLKKHSISLRTRLK